MRKVEFAEPTSADWRAWCAKCDRARADAVAAVARGAVPDISPLYRGRKNDFTDPQAAFRGKCAFCEQKVTSNQHGDIEHYRPKAAVKERDGSFVVRQQNGREERHPGYYWLAYDWKNFLLSCVLCNQLSATGFGKGNKFPVRGFRAWNPGEEGREEPLLVNPCTEDPALHFELSADTGILTGRTDRGTATIEILGLNERDLPHARRERYADTVARFNVIESQRAARGLQWMVAEIQALFRDETREFTSVSQLAVARERDDLLAAMGQI